MAFKDTYNNAVFNLVGSEYLKEQTDRNIKIASAMAPVSGEAKRRYWEQKRSEAISAQEGLSRVLTDEYILNGFRLDDGFFAKIGRIAGNIDGLTDADFLRVWHWSTAYYIGLINYELLTADSLLPISGIAVDFSDYIDNTDDKTLSYIIREKRLPDGAYKARWIGKEQDAHRFKREFSMTAKTFNSCFQMKAGKPIEDKNFKPGYLDEDRTAPIYAITAKYKPI